MSSFIYKITNQIDGKIYVGLTCRSLEGRFASHRSAAKQKPHYPLYAAMNKDGFDNFSIEAIEELPYAGNRVYEREQYWITHFNSGYPHGYNFDKASLKKLETRDNKSIPGNNATKQKTILTRLERLWRTHPDLRLGQLILNCFPEDFYSLTDEEMLSRMERIYSNIDRRDEMLAEIANISQEAGEY